MTKTEALAAIRRLADDGINPPINPATYSAASAVTRAEYALNHAEDRYWDALLAAGLDLDTLQDMIDNHENGVHYAAA